MDKPAHKVTASAVDGVIVREISRSGLKATKQFFTAIEKYNKVHKITGEKAVKVKVYLAHKAISIKKADLGIFGVKTKTLDSSDVKAAVYGYHVPVDLDDHCSAASRQIMKMERSRPKGKSGVLTRTFSSFLDNAE